MKINLPIGNETLASLGATSTNCPSDSTFLVSAYLQHK